MLALSEELISLADGGKYHIHIYHIPCKIQHISFTTYILYFIHRTVSLYLHHQMFFLESCPRCWEYCSRVQRIGQSPKQWFAEVFLNVSSCTKLSCSDFSMCKFVTQNLDATDKMPKMISKSSHVSLQTCREVVLGTVAPGTKYYLTSGSSGQLIWQGSSGSGGGGLPIAGSPPSTENWLHLRATEPILITVGLGVGDDSGVKDDRQGANLC